MTVGNWHNAVMARDDGIELPFRSGLPATETDVSTLRFAPIDRTTLQNQVYEQLRDAVMGGLFQPGTPITIRAVASALGTSPMPARSALQRLEIAGALVAQGGKRTLVIPEMSQAEYQEMLDIGVLLEGHAAHRACSQISAEEVAIMGASCKAMEDAANGNDRDRYVTENWTFHSTLYAASRLPTLMSFIEMRWLRIGPYVRHMMPDQLSLQQSMPNHWSVLEAIKRGDADAARDAIVADLRDCAETLMPRLGPGCKLAESKAGVASSARTNPPNC